MFRELVPVQVSGLESGVEAIAPGVGDVSHHFYAVVNGEPFVGPSTHRVTLRSKSQASPPAFSPSQSAGITTAHWSGEGFNAGARIRRGSSAMALPWIAPFPFRSKVSARALMPSWLTPATAVHW